MQGDFRARHALIAVADMEGPTVKLRVSSFCTSRGGEVRPRFASTVNPPDIRAAATAR